MEKIILTDELLDWIYEEYEKYKQEEDSIEMIFDEYKDFKLWMMENEHKMNRHAWLENKGV